MRKSTIAVAFLAILFTGCAADTATESTLPEETTAGTAIESTQPLKTTAETAAVPEKTAPTTPAVPEKTAPTTAGTAVASQKAAPATAAVPEKAAPATGAPASALPTPVGRVSAIGDSVMLGAVYALQQQIPNLGIIDAQVSLQVAAAIDILRSRRAAGQLGDVVVVHLGNNGTFTAEQFDEMMRVLAGVRRVVFVNLKLPRLWEQPNNAVLTNGVWRYPNTVLVDWRAASAYHPEYFWDGMHLTPQGAQAYAGLISAYLGG
jgi:hypothetical protein